MYFNNYIILIFRTLSFLLLGLVPQTIELGSNIIANQNGFACNTCQVNRM